MSDPRLLMPTRWGDDYPTDVVARTKDGLVHAVKSISDGSGSGWELGQWRMLSLYCGQIMKHHPKKLDRSATGAVTCLGCIGVS